jgi:hypothetical protein
MQFHLYMEIICMQVIIHEKDEITCLYGEETQL